MMDLQDHIHDLAKSVSTAHSQCLSKKKTWLYALFNALVRV